MSDKRLIHLIQRVKNGTLWKGKFSGIEGIKRFHWDNLAKTMDDALEDIFN